MVANASLLMVYSLGLCVSLYLGIYVIRLNPEKPLNRVFLVLNIFLSLWILGYIVANTTMDIQRALLWRRIASVGRMFFYSIVLHFLLLLSMSKNQQRFKNIFVLIHVPAAVLVFVYSASSRMAPLQYNLVLTNFGWINKAVNNTWNYIYYAYFLSYVLIAFYVTIRWKQRLDKADKISQAKQISKNILVVIILGVLVDVVLNSLLTIPIPHITPILALLPIGAMYHAAKYHDILNIESPKRSEIILTDDQQKKIFTSLAAALIVSGLLAFSSQYFPLDSFQIGDLKASLSVGVALVAIGLCLYLIQLIKNKPLRHICTVGISLLSIPIISFYFLKYSVVTVWVLPIVIIFSSLLFSNRTLLLATTIVGVLIQIITWILRPSTLVLIDGYDFMARIIIIIAAFLLGLYINGIYINRIKKNAYQMSFQQMNTDISTDFISLHPYNFDEKIDKLLARIGAFFEVDRTYLFIIDHQNETMTYSNEWCNTGIPPEVGTIDEMPLSVFPWWIGQLEDNNLVKVEDVQDMPAEASAEQAQLLRQQVKSLVSVPVIGEDGIQGFIGIDSVLCAREWSRDNIDTLHIMANLIANAIIKVKIDKKIAFMAHYDHLTSLPNRFLFTECVEKAIQEPLGRGHYISIIFIDLDNFKTVNDTIGHKGGDLLLKKVARGLEGLVRSTDMVARFGGDEFMILLNQVPKKVIIDTADRIMQLFSETFTVNNQSFYITASAGISVFPEDGKKADELVKNADLAMYRAKFKGKNQYSHCTVDMKDQIKNELEITKDLQDILERNELMVYYQPQIDLNACRITGVEALLRWAHPEKGLIMPLEFISIAEKNGFINDIGDWVLKTACAQNKRWQDMGLPPMLMAVNLSGIQLLNPQLANRIDYILTETGLDSAYLELEITESIAIREANYAIEALNKLKKLGVSIAIDDFGTEYSSLNRLKLLPIDRIKIDMQFIQGIESSEKDQAITNVIIQLAKSLGLNVLAEGVETLPQLTFLNQKTCDNVQGFYCFKPLPPEKMEKLLIDLMEATQDERLKLLKLDNLMLESY